MHVIQQVATMMQFNVIFNNHLSRKNIFRSLALELTSINASFRIILRMNLSAQKSVMKFLISVISGQNELTELLRQKLGPYLGSSEQFTVNGEQLRNCKHLRAPVRERSVDPNYNCDVSSVCHALAWLNLIETLQILPAR